MGGQGYCIFSHFSHYHHRVDDPSLHLMTTSYKQIINSNILFMSFKIHLIIPYVYHKKLADGGLFRHYSGEEDCFIHIRTLFSQIF